MDESEFVTPEFVESMFGRQRWFWLLLLKKGPIRNQDSETVARHQLAHLQHLWTLCERGQLTLFGPVDGAGWLRGIGVLTAAGRAEAEALMAGDPMIQAGRLRAEIRPRFTLPGASLPLWPCASAGSRRKRKPDVRRQWVRRCHRAIAICPA